jgi:hypothetical protein
MATLACDGNASVPEKLLGESGEQESGAGVTQVVEAGVGETGLVQERREAALSEAGEEFMMVPVSVVKTRVLVVVVEFSEGAKYAKG